MTRYERWSILLQVLIFLVGLGVACIYYRQLRTMMDTLVTVQDGAEAQQRAQIAIKDAAVKPDFTTAPRSIPWTFKNVGHAAASMISASIGYQLLMREGDRPRLLQKNPMGQPMGFAFAGMMEVGDERTIDLPIAALPDDFLRQFKAGIAMFQVAGFIFYSDGFGMRVTSLCWMFGNGTKVTSEPCARHNMSTRKGEPASEIIKPPGPFLPES